MLAEYFKGPEDPDFAVIKIVPKVISVLKGMGENHGSVEF